MSAVEKAVWQFGWARARALAGTLRHNLQRMSATGIYEGETARPCRTLWDEYCHEVQNGPHDALQFAWDSVLDPLADAQIAKLAPEEKQILTCACDDFDFEAEEPVIDESAIRALILEKLHEIADARNLEAFEE